MQSGPRASGPLRTKAAHCPACATPSGNGMRVRTCALARRSGHRSLAFARSIAILSTPLISCGFCECRTHICSPPNRSPRVIPTRSPIRFPTRVLDSMLKQDRRARVACETPSRRAWLSLQVRSDDERLGRFRRTWCARAILRIGYNSSEMGFDGATCAVLNAIGKQSSDIAMGVDRESEKAQGAGDQGLMFGYASNETDVLMPAPITLAHRLVKRQADIRRSGKTAVAAPRRKSQITLRYEDFKPVGIDAVVLSTQHHPDVTAGGAARRCDGRDHQAGVARPNGSIAARAFISIPPVVSWIGGPVGDCGVTGRKIIVDTLWRHGTPWWRGVLRQGSIEGRPLGGICRALRRRRTSSPPALAERCEIQVSYADWGRASPLRSPSKPSAPASCRVSG